MIYNLYIVKGLVQSDIIAIAYGHDVSHVDITPPYIYICCSFAIGEQNKAKLQLCFSVSCSGLSFSKGSSLSSAVAWDRGIAKRKLSVYIGDT